jgi:hypothetical protein
VQTKARRKNVQKGNPVAVNQQNHIKQNPAAKDKAKTAKI